MIMSLQDNRKYDLAYDTSVFREASAQYKTHADDLRKMASRLNNLLHVLAEDGWTTDAGAEFQKMAEVNWEEDVKKYADLLDTLSEILIESSRMYEDLSENYIEKTKIR